MLALFYASDELRGNAAFMLRAVVQDVEALRYASPALLMDREFMLDAVRKNVQVGPARTAITDPLLLRSFGRLVFVCIFFN